MMYGVAYDVAVAAAITRPARFTSAILNCAKLSGLDSDAVGSVSAAEEVVEGAILLVLVVLVLVVDVEV